MPVRPVVRVAWLVAGCIGLHLGAVGTAEAAPAPATTTAAVGRAQPALAPTARKVAPGPAAYERRTVRWTNRERRSAGRHALKRTRCLDAYARASAARMAASARLTHQNLRRVLRRCGGSKVGENIAYGYRWPKHVVAAWMASPGHRANILETRYRRIGVGVRVDRRGVVWVSQVFAYRR